MLIFIKCLVTFKSYTSVSHSARLLAGVNSKYGSSRKIHIHPMKGHRKIPRGGGGESYKKPSEGGVWIFSGATSLRSWRYCRRARIKVLAAKPLGASGEAARRMGRGTLKYRLHKNHGFLNSPHTSVREKRIGQEKYIRQSNVR